MRDVSGAAARPSEDDPKVHERGSEERWPEPERKGGKKEDDTKSSAPQEPTQDPPDRDLGGRPS